MENGNRRSLIGLACLLVNGTLLSFVLLWLRGLPNHSSSAVLALGNLILGAAALLPMKRLRGIPRPSFLMILLWSLTYCFTYYSFVTWPQYLSLSMLRTAQVIAPATAVFLTGDWKQDSSSSVLQKLLSLGALVFLIAAVFIKNPVGTHGFGTFLFAGIAICYVGSQSAARILSRSVPPIWTSIHLSLTNGLILELLLLSRGTKLLDKAILLNGLVLTVGIVAVQLPLLIGLRWAPPLMAAVALAAAVPIAVILEAATTKSSASASGLLFCASIVFLLTTGLIAVMRMRRQIRV